MIASTYKKQPTRNKLIILTFCILFLGIWNLPAALADTQSLTVTGTVIPHASDFQLAISSNSTSTISQDGIITYTITYGSHLLYADQLKIEAQWYQGTITGNTTANIDGLSYVSGSASTATNSTNPVVDLTNNKIDWTITSFPANTTDKTVTFQLKTTTAYTGSSTVTFPIKVRLISPNFTTSDQSVFNSYLYDPTKAQQTGSSGSSTTTTSTASTNTPAANTNSGSTTQPTNTPTTTAPVQPTTATTTQSHVNSVNVVDLSQDSAQIALTLNKTGALKVIYGTSPTNLSGVADTAVSGNSGLVSLDNLAPQTTYYMQMLTTDATGRTTASEIFSVQTAQISDKPEVAKTSIVVATDNDVLYSASLNNNPQGQSAATQLNTLPQIPVAQDTDYTLAFKLTKTQAIKSVTVILKNTSVLGASTFTPPSQPLEYSFPVSQRDNGTYSVQITDPTVAGTYDAYIRITDYQGNITTQKIAQIRSLKPFRVYNSVTKKPIEDIRIFIWRQNSDSKKFEALPNINGIRNPLYTNIHGEANEQLPKGNYKVLLSRIGYSPHYATFSLGINQTDDFPTVYLRPTAITPLTILRYYRNAFVDWFSTTQSYIQSIQASNRFFDLYALAVILCFVTSTFYLFRFKTHIAFSHLHYYIHHHSLLLFGGRESPYIHGSVRDKDTKQPIADASLFLLEEKTHRVVGQTSTNKTGGFVLPAEKISGYLLYIMKQGYEPSGQIAYSPQIVVNLQKGEAVNKKILEVIQEETENAFALFFEFVLVFSVILELILFPAFGYYKTIPFLLLSFLNVILWGFYLREKGKQLSVN